MAARTRIGKEPGAVCAGLFAVGSYLPYPSESTIFMGQ